ncbi:ABC transporter ATP-binding protein [Pedobacter zeae]|uniref:ABC transporter ATP-binding protein n=1 Tax=Pedobacter zeae TaxID=1737356 RepID=A0A7W6K8J3_9SPHI|nr:ATP-binding cassette domain-containing protein [Pedobacter zeae]MBB4107171.1 ABC-2 type transport system ATP-binding protein [Pedobacter zeae]GGH06149.1 ABC transporter ATP-binding protein [Pedobacter zeae]
MLEAIGLTKKYQEHVALNNLNLKVEAGEVFCLLGQNGAGKTTTINLFLGFTAASSGEARINNILVSPNNAQTKQFLAYIPEVVMLYGHLSSIENLDFFSRIAGYSYTINELEAFLLKAGLQPEAFHKRVGQYSKGMRQKVGIAIAVAKNAKVILMDEPTSGLDPKATDEFSEIVKQLSRDGRSVFMATHDIFNAVNVGTRIGIMRQGTLMHTLEAKDISAVDLQKLYLETI